MLVRFLAVRFYNAGCIIGHLRAKFILGYNQFNNWGKSPAFGKFRQLNNRLYWDNSSSELT